MCVWLGHLSNQLRLLTCAFLLVSDWASVRTASCNLSCPAHGSGWCNWAIASCSRTCQSLLTCVSTSCRVSSEAWRMVHPGRTPWCLWQWGRHAVRHGQTGVTCLMAERFVASNISWHFLIHLFLGRRCWQVVEGIELMSITKIALPLGLR